MDRTLQPQAAHDLNDEIQRYEFLSNPKYQQRPFDGERRNPYVTFMSRLNPFDLKRAVSLLFRLEWVVFNYKAIGGNTEHVADEDLDRYVAELITAEAKKKEEKYQLVGLDAYLKPEAPLGFNWALWWISWLILVV